jgi:hypothetical protein
MVRERTVELGIVRCGVCQRKYAGEACPFCAKDVARSVATTADVASDVATCITCRQHPPQTGRRECAGCRQKAYRDRHSNGQ